MRVELKQLRQVIALAESGSFSRAAAALHISQPALSRSIQGVERDFGSELFVRSGAGVVPTDFGRVLIERARDVLRLADELAGEHAAAASQRTGRVAMGGGPFPAASFLAAAAARFSRDFPLVSVVLCTGSWDELLRMLRARELDFFVAETSTLAREADLEIVPVPNLHPVYWAARAGHPLARSKKRAAEEILQWPFVAPARIPPRILAPLLAARRRGRMTLPFPAIACNSLDAATSVVRDSDAVTGSTLSCIRQQLESGTLVLLGTEPWLHLQYGVVSLRGRPWTQAATHLRDAVLVAQQDVMNAERQLAQRYLPQRSRPSPVRRAQVRQRRARRISR